MYIFSNDNFQSQSNADESVPIVASSTSAADIDEMDEDALMQQALQLSMMDAAPTVSGNVC